MFNFHNDTYFQAFLDTLGEACQRFDCVIHAYCLLSNPYHLLIETPKANISRVKQHLNGVYIQRYNRLKRTDGPLFCGRFKSILVDQDSYLLQLSRYIHRNPFEMKSPLVANLANYKWSSYPAYIVLVEPLSWLERDKTYPMLGHVVTFEGYAALLPELDAEGKSNVIQPDLTMDHMIAGIADDNDISVMEVTRLIKGPQKK